ncbi:MAG: hypothetical protein RMH84_04550 [Sulfolobales archaeon]|nr:hypothetical protein [Sulfolobales archaeon]MCX8208393.1 hypothetical protein [Sulfolobales archaeon]MDW8010844.1 hypothetical protein [Sulfolobales archaeon]
MRDILREVAGSVVELDYPINYRERSIDFVATIGERTRDREAQQFGSRESLVVRVGSSRGFSISDEVENDLAKFADAVDGVPVAIDDELYDNIVFDYGKIFVSNERTLENVVKERELITIYRRNELYVALNSKLIEREISQGSLRVSDVSNALGLSKKSVESCLKGLGLVSIDRAERLVSEYGPEMILSINYGHLREIFRRKNPPQSLVREMDTGTLVYSLNKTAVDVVIREASFEGVRSLRFYVDFSRTRSIKYVKTKIENALRLAREFGASVEVVVPDQPSLELLKKEIVSDIGEEVSRHVKFSSRSQVRTFQHSST